MKRSTLVVGGIALNVAGSLLIDTFYHESLHGGFGYSDWGYTAWMLRLTGVGMLISALVSYMQENPPG